MISPTLRGVTPGRGINTLTEKMKNSYVYKILSSSGLDSYSVSGFDWQPTITYVEPTNIDLSYNDPMYMNISDMYTPTPPIIKEEKSGPVHLYHMIYNLGPTVYNLVTFAHDEKEAKKKIIERLADHFDKDFPNDIENSTAHKTTGDVLKVYEKVR
jgi:hypothetical protein